jgi:pimeloyl-ACP methyl ester carboxylesterase
MDSGDEIAFRTRAFALSERGGAMAGLEFGPTDRCIDMVFLHANGFNALTYRHLLAPLASRYRILAVDQRGHGATRLPAESLGRTGWNDLRDDLLALLGVLDLPRVILAGHSLGGTVSLLAAHQAPERVRRLVLLDPVILPEDHDPSASAASPMVQGAIRRRSIFPDRTTALDAYRGRGAFKTWPESVLRDYVSAGFAELPNGEVTLACAPAWEASNFASHGHDVWGALRDGGRPIHILRADHESTCRFEGMASSADRIRVKTIPGTTHFLPMEKPEPVRAALEAALRSE